VISARHSITGLKLVSTNLNLTVRLIPEKGNSSTSEAPFSWQLEVMVNAKAPIGVIEDKVTVTTPSGQKLIVPVFASVSRF